MSGRTRNRSARLARWSLFLALTRPRVRIARGPYVPSPHRFKNLLEDAPAMCCGRSFEGDHIDGCLTQSLCICDLPFGLGDDADVGFKRDHTRIGVRATARPSSLRVEQLEVEVERKP